MKLFPHASGSAHADAVSSPQLAFSDSFPAMSTRKVSLAPTLSVSSVSQELDILMRHVSDGITIQDKLGKIVFANERAAKIIGFTTVGELLSASVQDIMSRFELFTPFGQPLALSNLPSRQAMQGEEPPEMLVRFRVKATGEERWSVVRAFPRKDAAGNVLSVLNFFHDVTEQKHDEQRAAFLTRASEVLASSLDSSKVVQSVADLVVPHLADWCAVLLVDEAGKAENAAVAHVDPAMVEWAHEIQRQYPPDLQSTQGVAMVYRTGKSLLLQEVTDDMIMQITKDENRLKLLRKIGMSSLMIVPIIAREKILGTLSFVAAESRMHYREEDLAFAEDLAKRIGLAIDNSRLYKSIQQELEERRHAEEEVRRLNEELEAKVQQRTSALRWAQEEDRTNLQRLRLMIENMPMAAVAADEAGRILNANVLFCELFGFGNDPTRIIGKPGEEILEAAKEHLQGGDDLAEGLRRILSMSVPVLNAELPLKDGRILSCDYIPVSEAGRHRGHLLLYRDVTQERRLDRAKSEFMSLASHQLRTPLTSIRWMLGRLERTLQDRLGAEEIGQLEQGRRSAARLSETIDTMLQISKIEAGQVQLRTEVVDLGVVLSDVAGIHGTLAQRRGQTISVRTTGEVLLETDSRLLKEVLGNLVINAIKYSPPGGSVTLTAKEKNGKMEIQVIDTGFGIPKQQQVRVFQKFFRADNIIGAETKGTGLGLYLVSLILDLLGGTITFVSKERHGTTFTITLPRSLLPRS